MLQIDEYKGQKEQKCLFPRDVQPKKCHALEKDINAYKIGKLVFFLIAILLIEMTVKLSLKPKGPTIKDIIISYDYYNRIKDPKKLDLNFERNYSETSGYSYQDIIFNPLNFLISS